MSAVLNLHPWARGEMEHASAVLANLARGQTIDPEDVQFILDRLDCLNRAMTETGLIPAAPQVALTDALPELPEPLECISIAEGTIVIEADEAYRADQMHAYARQYAAQCIEARNQQGDAARGRFVTEFGAWHRHLGKTYLAVEVAEKADLSCLAFRRDALDAAIEQRKADKKGGGN